MIITWLIVGTLYLVTGPSPMISSPPWLLAVLGKPWTANDNVGLLIIETCMPVLYTMPVLEKKQSLSQVVSLTCVFFNSYLCQIFRQKKLFSHLEDIFQSAHNLQHYQENSFTDNGTAWNSGWLTTGYKEHLYATMSAIRSISLWTIHYKAKTVCIPDKDI